MTALLVGLIALPLLVGLLIGALRAPFRTIVPLYAAIIPWGSSIELPIPVPEPFNTPSTIIGLIAALALAAHIAASRERPRRTSQTIAVWLLFLGVAALTTLWSTERAATVRGVLVLASVVALFVVAGLAPARPRDLRAMESGAIVGGVSVALYAVYLLAGPGLPTTESEVPRLALAGGIGEEGDPNITAAILILPFALALGRMATPGPTEPRVAYGMAAAGIAGAIFMTGSRGGILAALVAVIVIAVNARSFRTITIVLATLAVVGVAAWQLAPPELRDRLTKKDPTGTGRTEVWRVGLHACRTYCLAGGGFAAFRQIHQNTVTKLPEAGGTRSRWVAHNIWLAAATEVGVAGLLLAGGAILLSIRELLSVPRSHRGPPLAGLAGLVVANMFLSNLAFKYFWLGLMQAMLTVNVHGAADRAPEPREVRVPAPPQAGAGIVVPREGLTT